MPRQPRIHIEQGLYFITTRGDHGGELFKDEADYSEYLHLLAKYKAQYRFRLFSYGLLSTYLHLLIELAKETTISEIMHVINSSYTRYFNGRYEKRGHLFQERFKAVVVEKDSYLVELTRYVHLLPVTAHLADNPEAYKWTSYQDYLEMRAEDPLGVKNDAKEVLGRLSPDAPNRDEQIRLYREFVQAAEKEKLEQLRKKLQRSRVPGSKEFAEGVKAKVKKEAVKEQKEEQKAWVASGAHKVFLIAGGLAIIGLSVLTVHAYRANMGLKRGFEDMMQRKENEFNEELSAEQEKLRENLEERYRADMVSYEATRKRLEAEQKKAEELKKKLGEQK